MGDAASDTPADDGLVLSNGRVRIRLLRRADDVLFLRWWNDGEVMRHVGFPRGLGWSAERVRSHIAEALEHDGPDALSRRFVIEDAGTDSAIGEVSYSRWDRTSGTVAVGIKICETAAQRKGFGVSALGLFVDWLFERLRVSRVELDTFARNRAARALYERLGFRQVGVKQRECFSETTQALEDVVLYEKVAGGPSRA